jgi:N-acetylmuramoyl-L-alanine amidase
MDHTNKLIIYLRIVITISLLAAIPLAGSAESVSAQPLQKTVVIDPGHGGNEAGVKGVDGTLEKDVTLRLARLLENRLKDRYQVLLTRKDDYVMPRPDRTGLANHHKASLLISLHTAGSYRPTANGLQVWYYTPAQVKAPQPVSTGSQAATPWREVQKPHIAASSNLAQRIWENARALNPGHPGSVQSAPAAVLAGADMPAILIETGYLTNPKQEKNLNDNKYLFKLATAISQGIDDFFSNPETISSEDLRE